MAGAPIIPMAIGAGAGALMSDNPLKGAALGGLGGFFGGQMLPGLMGGAGAGGIGATEAGLGTIGAPGLAMHEAAMAGAAAPSLAGPLGSMGGYAAGTGGVGGAAGALGLPGMQPGAADIMGAAMPVSGLGVANGGNSAMDMMRYGKMLMPNQQQQQRTSGGSAPMPRMSAGGQAFAPYGPAGSPVGARPSASRMVFGR